MEIRKRFEYLFIAWGCFHPEECVDETLNRIAHQINEAKPIETKNHFAYIWGVARNVYYEYNRVRKEESESEQAVEDIADPGNDLTVPEGNEVKNQRLFCLDNCLQGLSETKRMVAKFYLPGHGAERISKRKSLAKFLGVSGGALRITGYRVRQELVDCILECLAKRLVS